MIYNFTQEEKKAIHTSFIVCLKKLKFTRKERRFGERLCEKFNAASTTIRLKPVAFRKVAMISILNLSVIEGALVSPEIEEEELKERVEQAHAILAKVVDKLEKGML